MTEEDVKRVADAIGKFGATPEEAERFREIMRVKGWRKVWYWLSNLFNN